MGLIFSKPKQTKVQRIPNRANTEQNAIVYFDMDNASSQIRALRYVEEEKEDSKICTYSRKADGNRC